MNEATKLRIIECAEAVERACRLRSLAVECSDFRDAAFWSDSAAYWSGQAFRVVGNPGLGRGFIG